MTDNSNFAQHRFELESDPYRPLFHFVAPCGWMNDPNGTVYWRGRWHLFYQYSPGLLETGEGCAHWGHAVSADLVHWQDLPIALAPTPGTYDEKGCWSGTSWVEEDRVIANYHAHMGGNCIATACDDLLLDWVKLPANPIAAFDPEKTYDPCIWKENGTYYSISGRITGARYGHGADQEFGGKDIAYLYKSDDLNHWNYAGSFYEGGIYTNPGEDCACPNFFSIGDKHMLLFLSHNQGAQYYIGSYLNGRFVPESHGRMNFTVPTLARLVTCGDFAAPISWAGPGGRRIVVAWVPEGRTEDAMKAAGWAGIISLPRDISLGVDGRLKIEPIPEILALRKNMRTISNITLNADQPVAFEHIRGNTLEMFVRIEPGTADKVGASICRSPDGEEETVIIIDLRAGTLTLDPSRAGLSPEFVGRDAQVAPFDIAPGEAIELRIFIDRSVVEVFANSRQCVTKRIYPSRPDSLGVQFFAGGGEAVIRKLDAWDMDSVWPVS